MRAGDDLGDPRQFADWVAWLHRRPGHRWWITDGDKILGAVALRPAAENGHRVTGHIGYGVVPSARGRGIAGWALREALTQARVDGMPGCVLVCLDDNEGSIKVIEKAGGTLTARVEDEGRTLRHYWIATS